jgi:hypothetical protein
MNLLILLSLPTFLACTLCVIGYTVQTWFPSLEVKHG